MRNAAKRHKKIVAIATADWHLTLRPPVWRSNESDWLAAQQRPLDQILMLQEQYRCPILLAGDVFDRWNSPPELINWAIKVLATRWDNIYAIPGQHDLPNHRIDDIKRSAFWTLVMVGAIIDYDKEHKDFSLHRFPATRKIEPLVEKSDKLSIAIVHDYVWKAGYGYEGAPADKHLPMGFDGKYYGYDVIIYGDNHKGFLTKVGKTTVFNCGTLMRRKSDEADYKPWVGLITSEGEVEPHYLDISEDKHLEAVSKPVDEKLDIRAFIEELEKLGKTTLDFEEAIKQYFVRQTERKQVQEIILKAMNNLLKTHNY